MRGSEWDGRASVGATGDDDCTCPVAHHRGGRLLRSPLQQATQAYPLGPIRRARAAAPPPSWVSHQSRPKFFRTFAHHPKEAATQPTNPPPRRHDSTHRGPSDLDSQGSCGPTARMADVKKDEATKAVQVEALVRKKTQ